MTHTPAPYHLHHTPHPPAPVPRCPCPRLPAFIHRERGRVTSAPPITPINFTDPSINPQGPKPQLDTQTKPVSLFRTILNLCIL